MKFILLLCGAVLIAGIAWAVVALRAPNHYGNAFASAPRVPFGELVEKPQEYLGKQVTIEGKVADQCPTTGCFFYFDDGKHRLKVEMGDIAQSLPKRSGATATVEGQLSPLGDSYQFLGSGVEFH